MLLESRAIETLGHTVPIHAIELHEYRMQLHAERMRQAGIEDVMSLAGDACVLDAIDGVLPCYDAVLLDAPCSGTGTMRRHPEIRWKLTPADVTELAILQCAMLDEAARHVAVAARSSTRPAASSTRKTSRLSMPFSRISRKAHGV